MSLSLVMGGVTRSVYGWLATHSSFAHGWTLYRRQVQHEGLLLVYCLQDRVGP
jgi:hypothetical protein